MDVSGVNMSSTGDLSSNKLPPVSAPGPGTHAVVTVVSASGTGSDNTAPTVATGNGVATAGAVDTTSGTGTRVSATSTGDSAFTAAGSAPSTAGSAPSAAVSAPVVMVSAPSAAVSTPVVVVSAPSAAVSASTAVLSASGSSVSGAVSGSNAGGGSIVPTNTSCTAVLQTPTVPASNRATAGGVSASLTTSALLPSTGALRLGVVSSLGRGVVPDDLIGDPAHPATNVSPSTPSAVSADDTVSSPGSSAGDVKSHAAKQADKTTPIVSVSNEQDRSDAVSAAVSYPASASVQSPDVSQQKLSRDSTEKSLSTPVKSGDRTMSSSIRDCSNQSIRDTHPVVTTPPASQSGTAKKADASHSSPTPAPCPPVTAQKPALKFHTESTQPKLALSTDSNAAPKVAAVQSAQSVSCEKVSVVKSGPDSPAVKPKQSSPVTAANSAENKTKPLPALTPISPGIGTKQLAVTPGVLDSKPAAELNTKAAVSNSAEVSVKIGSHGVTGGQVTSGSVSESSVTKPLDKSDKSPPITPVKTVDNAENPAHSDKQRRATSSVTSSDDKSGSIEVRTANPGRRSRAGATASAANEQKSPGNTRNANKRKAATRQPNTNYKESDEEYECDSEKSAETKSPPTKRSRATPRRQQSAPVDQSQPTKKTPTRRRSPPTPSTPAAVSQKKRVRQEEEDDGGDGSEVRTTTLRGGARCARSTGSASVVTPERQSSRHRVAVRPFQSPLSQFESIPRQLRRASTAGQSGIGVAAAAVTAERSPKQLILFFKNEFLAIRSESGGYYVCQCVQNVTRKSGSVKIRWMTDHKNNIYTPDFYDSIDFDCILTSLDVKCIGRSRYQLAECEAARAAGILARAVARDSGQLAADESQSQQQQTLGLDISLYTDVSQLVTESPRGGGGQHQSSSAAAAADTTDSSARPRRTATPARSPTNGHSVSRDPQASSPIADTQSEVGSKPAPAKTSDKITPGIRRTKRRLLP